MGKNKIQIFKPKFALLFLLSLVVLGCSTSKVSKKTETKESSYLVSDGTPFVSKTKYPKFSWDTAPMYYHFGDIERVLNPREVEFIAEKTDFIAIEKSHAYRELGDVVLGTKHEVEAFHEVKPDVKVLFYFNSFVVWPFSQFNKDFTPNGIAKNPELKGFLTVDWKTGKLKFMKNRNGADIAYYFNALNPEFREWWVNSVVKGAEISNSDGVFIDRMDIGSHSGYPEEKSVEVEIAKREMMAELKKKLGEDKIIVGNNAAGNHYVFPFCDAFMFEHAKPSWLSKENLLEEWSDMLKVAKAGKISIFRFGVKGGTRPAKGVKETNMQKMARWSEEQAEYYLACYLIGAQPYSYFQFNWGWNLSDGNLVEYPDFLKPLGAPKESYKRVTKEGWEFTREFEKASVWLDTDKKKAKITWN